MKSSRDRGDGNVSTGGEISLVQSTARLQLCFEDEMVAVGAIIALSGYKMALDTVTRSRLDYIFLERQPWPHVIIEAGKGMIGKDRLISTLFLILISTEKLRRFFAFI